MSEEIHTCSYYIYTLNGMILIVYCDPFNYTQFNINANIYIHMNLISLYTLCIYISNFICINSFI